MKQLPDEKELAEIVELARIAAEKARNFYEMATVMAQKCHLPSETTVAASKKQAEE